jgi:hypothetical protein
LRAEEIGIAGFVALARALGGPASTRQITEKIR